MTGLCKPQVRICLFTEEFAWKRNSNIRLSFWVPLGGQVCFLLLGHSWRSLHGDVRQHMQLVDGERNQRACELENGRIKLR